MTAQHNNGNSLLTSNLKAEENTKKETNLQQNSQHEAGEEQKQIEDKNPQNNRKLLAFFEEDNGNLSSMRLMNIISLIAAILCGGYTLINPKVKDVGIELTNTFLLAAVGPKAVQKFIENQKMK